MPFFLREREKEGKESNGDKNALNSVSSHE